MTQVFEHTDSYGDQVKITHGGGSNVYAATRDSSTTGPAVALTPADVDRLRDALKPYGTRREAPAETGYPAAVLDYVDPDGDTLTVYTRTNPGEPLALVLGAEAGEELSANLTPEGVTRLRAALKAFDPVEADPEPVELKAGDRARVVGDSMRWHHGFTPGTSVTLHAETDNYSGARGGRGGWWCQGESGEWWNVATADLAPLAPPLASDDAIARLRERLSSEPGYASRLTALPPTALESLSNGDGFFATDETFPLDARRVAAAREAMAILGEDGAGVDLEALLGLAEFLAGGGK